MFTRSQLTNMNYDMRFSSSLWIRIIEDKNKINKINDNYDLYKLYHTNNSSMTTGTSYIAFPIDKVLSYNDFVKYNISK